MAEVKQRPVLELWIDDAPSTVLKPSYFDALQATGFSTIAVMVDTAKGGWDPIWSAKNLEALRRLADARKIGIVLTTWPDPVRQYLDDMSKGMDALLQASGAVGWEVDTEFNWKPEKVRGFKAQPKRTALDLAGDYLVDVMTEAKSTHGVRRELTTFTSHTENGRAADVAPQMDLLLVQAYSIRKRPGGQIIEWGHTYAPGNMQKFTLDRTMLVPGVKEGKVEVGIGQAAWDQTWPGHTPTEAMNIAFKTAVTYGVRRTRFWSSKWVVGRWKQAYAANFVKSLRGEE